MSPSQVGAVGAGPGTGVILLPQLSLTVGNVGITMSATQATVALVDGIAANGSRSMVTVWVYTLKMPRQPGSALVPYTTLFRAGAVGAGPGTGVILLPQLSL